MLNLAEFVRATGAQVHGPTRESELAGFAYDSRADCQARAFLALRTATGDGHDHIAEAVAKGAGAVICERLPDMPSYEVPFLLVSDVLAALADWAGDAVRRWAPRVIAVTGSLGKTTTKSLITHVLSGRLHVTESGGNLSGRLGLPIALAECDRSAGLAVLEFASGHFGELQAMAAMAHPNTAVVMNVHEPHLDVFGTLDNAAAEMSAIIHGPYAASLAVLNRDDERVWAMSGRAAQVISFGLGPADVRASDIQLGADGLSFTVHWRGHAARCKVGLYAPALVYDCLAAIAVGLTEGLSLEECAQRLGSARREPGRLNLMPGLAGATILDDTFSGCPTSALAAIEALRLLPGRRRHLVLGGLDDTEGVDGWRSALAEAVTGSGASLWALGDQGAEVASEAARLGEQVKVYYSLEDLTAALASCLEPGDLVLVKGNRASRLERVVAGLVRDHTSGSLVRSEPYWQGVALVRPDRPTWVEIDAEALAQNVRLLRRVCGVPLMAVLKADGYGHGAVRVARIALANGAESLGVACLSEARALREAGISAPILILGYTPAWQARQAVRLGIACTVFSWDEAEALARAGTETGLTASVHVKVDTGMARLGLWPEQVPPFLARLRALPSLHVQGIFTHFGSADEADKSYARSQLERFLMLLTSLEEAGLRPPLAHAANTAAALTMPASRLDMVRIGLGLYGLSPSPFVPLPAGMRPVLSFKTTVAQVKDVPAGTYIGYGLNHRAESQMRIAVIPVGYADGFRRGPRNWGEVLIRGRRCRLIGNVCMDQAMVDVTSVAGVRKGDEVVLIGSQGEASIGADEVAAELGTISYEVIAEILARVPRMA